MDTFTRIIGIDPGLRRTGWGVIDTLGNSVRFVASGLVTSDGDLDLASRLCQLHDGLDAVLAEYKPDEASIEQTFVNKDAGATLKLGQARGVVLLAPSLAGIEVAEYQAMEVKRAVVGTGHADKVQVTDMVRRLLPGAVIRRADAADALAVAICHAHHRGSRMALARMANLAVSQPR